MRILLMDLVLALSNAVDLVSPALTGHQLRVARISAGLAQRIGLSKDEQNDIFIAGLLHDCGALSLKERLEALHFEAKSPKLHCETGYQLLKNIKPLAKSAYYIRYHHTYWCDSYNYKTTDIRVPFAGHILHLADRIDVLCDRNKEILGQSNRIVAQIMKESGRMFSPELVRVFASLAKIEAFWLSVYHDSPFEYKSFISTDDALDSDEILEIAKLFERVIDFRSRFTSTHSSGVAAVAEELGNYAGLSDLECRKLRVAGHLHDLGKLAVPAEILEKKDVLDEAEFNMIKSHTYYTYKILDNIRGFEDIKEYAGFHHERINGKGYPFHLSGERLSTGARILAVADVFTAITEDRPYRKGMKSSAAIDVLDRMAGEQGIDAEICMLLKKNYDHINSIRISAQLQAHEEYKRFMETSARHVEISTVFRVV